jgi:hypothetical protein
MNLSTLIGGGANPYLEFAWLTSPNSTGQTIEVNVIRTLNIDTKITDTGNNGDIGSGTGITGTNTGLTLAGNQIGLKAGTYYFDAFTSFMADAITSGSLGLYNVTATKYISQIGYRTTSSTEINNLQGQFSINSSSILSITMWQVSYYNGNAIITNLNGNNGASTTITTTGADQRTTLKLWKLV